MFPFVFLIYFILSKIKKLGKLFVFNNCFTLTNSEKNKKIGNIMFTEFLKIKIKYTYKLCYVYFLFFI